MHGKGNETKTLICYRCECATYCSKECQTDHWKGGEEYINSHKKICDTVSEIWCAYESKRKRVDKAIRKGRIFTKPIIINGIERQCFLRPSEKFDYTLCGNSCDSLNNALCSSMDAFYKNIATLACGGNHLVFGNETISPQLQEKIQIFHEDLLSDFDPKTLKEEEISAMERTAELLQYWDRYWTDHNRVHKRSTLSVDRFITLYICYEPFDLVKQGAGGYLDKFEIEANVLKQLKMCHNSF